MGARDTPARDSVYESHDAATRPDDDQSEQYARIARDDVFHLLQDQRRRAVLRTLLTDRHDGPIPLSALAAYVSAVEHGDDAPESVGEIQNRVRTALHHSHLPLLDEYDVVEYDAEARTVEPKPLLAAFEPFLADGLDAGEEIVVDEVQVERYGYHDATVR